MDTQPSPFLSQAKPEPKNRSNPQLAEDEYRTARNGYRVHRVETNRYEHRDVWAAANGPIPSNCHIHHKNRKRDDNRLENLECIDAEEHLRMHGLTFEIVNHLNAVRSLKNKREFECVRCHAKCETRHRVKRFCSRVCGRKWLNSKLSAKRLMDRAKKRGDPICPVCDAKFIKNTERCGRPQIYCGRRCAAISANRKYQLRKGMAPTPSKYRVTLHAA